MKNWNEYYYGNIGQTPDINKIIAGAESKYIKAKSDKEYAEYVYNLAFEDYVDTIRTSPYKWRYHLPIVKAAIDELSSKGRKPNLHLVEGWVSEDFFNDEHEIKIKEIRSAAILNTGTFAYNILFDIGGITYNLNIPVRDVLTTEYIEYAYYGKYALLYEESKSCWSLICMDYTEKGMTDKIKQYFNSIKH